MASVTPDLTDELLAECESILRYEFRDRALLRQCLTHASAARTRLESNERLEFLGDAILGGVVCELLYRQFPAATEGDLTAIKSAMVSRQTCLQVAEQMGLERFVAIGKGLSVYRSVPGSILGAVFEALVAGVYLDGGWDASFEFVEWTMQPYLEESCRLCTGQNFKSVLQHLAQKTYGQTPVYHMLDQRGPDHSKCFKVAAAVGSEVYAAAWGTNKKEAEQKAAENALSQMAGKDAPHDSPE